jgi:hypothetical protein
MQPIYCNVYGAWNIKIKIKYFFVNYKYNVYLLYIIMFDNILNIIDFTNDKLKTYKKYIDNNYEFIILKKMIINLFDSSSLSKSNILKKYIYSDELYETNNFEKYNKCINKIDNTCDLETIINKNMQSFQIDDEQTTYQNQQYMQNNNKKQNFETLMYTILKSAIHMQQSNGEEFQNHVVYNSDILYTIKKTINNKRNLNTQFALTNILDTFDCKNKHDTLDEITSDTAEIKNLQNNINVYMHILNDLITYHQNQNKTFSDDIIKDQCDTIVNIKNINQIQLELNSSNVTLNNLNNQIITNTIELEKINLNIKSLNDEFVQLTNEYSTLQSEFNKELQNAQIYKNMTIDTKITKHKDKIIKYVQNENLLKDDDDAKKINNDSIDQIVKNIIYKYTQKKISMEKEIKENEEKIINYEKFLKNITDMLLEQNKMKMSNITTNKKKNMEKFNSLLLDYIRFVNK